MKKFLSIFVLFVFTTVIIFEYPVSLSAATKTYSAEDETDDTKKNCLKEFFTEKADAASEAFNSILESTDTALETAKETVGDFAEGTKQKASDAASKAGDITETVKNNVAEAGEAVADIATETGKKISDKATETTEAVKDTAKNLGNNIANSAQTLGKKARAFFGYFDKEAFQHGWDYITQLTGTTIATIQAKDLGEYARNISDAIEKLETDINNSAMNNRAVEQEKGFIFEKWHADTMNIDAAAKNSGERAWRLESNADGSVDISTTYGENASLKSYEDGAKSAKALSARESQQSKKLLEAYQQYNHDLSEQGKNPISIQEYADTQLSDDDFKEIFIRKYAGQSSIIPSDQIPQAVDYLTGKIDQFPEIGSKYNKAQREVYEETLKSLKDKLTSPDGVESKPLTSEELQAITELAKEGDFKAEEYGIKLSSFITKTDILNSVITPSAQAAVLQIALTAGPDIVSIIIDSIQDGDLDEARLKEIGIDAALSGTEGFAEGSISSAILLACKSGRFGAALKDISPNGVAVLTVLTIDAVRYGYKLSNGEITAYEYSDLMAEDVFVMIASQAAGITLQMLLPMIPFAYLAGSMAGGILASAGYSAGKQVVMKVIDADGFGAILPSEVTNAFNVAKDVIASFDLKEKASDFKNAVVSTSTNGMIYVMDRK